MSYFKPSEKSLTQFSPIELFLLIFDLIIYIKFKFSYYKFFSDFNPSANLHIPFSPI